MLMTVQSQRLGASILRRHTGLTWRVTVLRHPLISRGFGQYVPPASAASVPRILSLANGYVCNRDGFRCSV
jgi:hypothetical protein